jgi:hypothetical protein
MLQLGLDRLNQRFATLGDRAQSVKPSETMHE